MYYKAVMSDKIFNERSLLILDDIFGPGAFDAWVRAGALMPVKKSLRDRPAQKWSDV